MWYPLDDEMRASAVRLAKAWEQSEENGQSKWDYTFYPGTGPMQFDLSLTIKPRREKVVSKYRIKGKPPIDEFYLDDCKRIQRVLNEQGLDVSLEEAHYLWAQFSDSYCAGWLSIGEDDGYIWYGIKPLLEEVEE